MRIRLPKSTDFINSAKVFRKFIKKRSLPEYFVIKRYLAEEIFHTRSDNPRDLAIVISFLLGSKPSEICEVMGITYEEFISLHLPRCIRAKLAVFAELFMALFISAVVERDVGSIKLLLEHVIGTFADFKIGGLQQLLNFLGETAFDDERLKESKLFKKFNELMCEKQNILADLIFNYERVLSEALEQQGIFENVDEKVEEIIADIEERYLARSLFSKNDEVQES